MDKFVLSVCALLLAWPVTAQEKQGAAAPASAGIAAPFGVKDVFDMLNAKFSENMIIDVIHKENVRLALSPQDLIALMKAGATERILRELDPSLTAPKRADPPAPGPTAAPGFQPAPVAKTENKVEGDPNDPETPHKPGIYLYTETNGERKLNTIIKSVPQSSRSKMQGILGYALFAFIARAKATVHTPDRRPVFYLYVGETAEISGVVDSPGQLALVRMEPQTMQGLEGRRMLYAKQPHIGARVIVGTDPKAWRSVKSEQTGPKTFRLIPDVELEAGEYCFFFTSGGGVFPGAKGTAGSNVTLWDFSIDQ